MAGKSLAKNTAVMASGTLVSRVLGLIRNALLIAAIGALGGGIADAFSVANTLPNIIYNLLAGGVLNAILVPQIVRAMRHKDEGEGYVNRLLTIGGLVLLVSTVVLTLASTLLINLYAASFSEDWMAIAVVLGYWCIPQLFFYGVYTLIGQVLNARSVFGPYMWAPAVNNVVAIIGLVVFLVMYGSIPQGTEPSFWDTPMIALLAGTATLGVIAQALILIVPLRRSGFKYRPRLKGAPIKELTNTSKVATWAFAGLAIGQLSFLAISNVAAAAGTRLAEAGVDGAGNAAYSNAFLIVMLPQSLVTVSLVTAMFTQLSKNASDFNHKQVKADMSFGLRTLGVFSVLATALFMVLAIPLTQVIQFGRADFATYQATGNVLAALSVALIPLAIWAVILRVYYAYSDTRSVFYWQGAMALVVIIGCALTVWLLEPQWWVVGGGFSLSISYWIGSVTSYLALRRKLPSIDGTRIFKTYLRLVMAVIPAALIGWGILHLWGVETTLLGAFARVIAVGGIITGIYVLELRLLGVKEFDALAAKMSQLAAPITNRLTPRLLALPGAAGLRTFWARTGDFRNRSGDSVDTQTPQARAVDVLGVSDVVAGRYRIISRLQDQPLPIFAANDEILDHTVHLTIAPSEVKEPVLDSARRSALIINPHFPKTLRVIDEGDQGVIVTEAFNGTTLTDLARDLALTPTQARTIIGEAATALDLARKRGIHHQYLTPDSVVITDDDQVLVLGLGTYAAARGIEPSDPITAARIDSLALVGLLYAAVSGRWPRERAGASGLQPTIFTSGAPVPPSHWRDGVPSEIDHLTTLTFNGHDDGPFTPSEVAKALTPWPALTIEKDREQSWIPVLPLPGSDAAEPRRFDEIVAPDAEAPARPAQHSAQPPALHSAASPAAGSPIGTGAKLHDVHGSDGGTSSADAPNAMATSEEALDVANAPLPISPRIRALIDSQATTTGMARLQDQLSATGRRTWAALVTAGTAIAAGATTASSRIRERLGPQDPNAGTLNADGVDPTVVQDPKLTAGPGFTVPAGGSLSPGPVPGSIPVATDTYPPSAPTPARSLSGAVRLRTTAPVARPKPASTTSRSRYGIGGPIVLALMLIAVLVAGWWAFDNLRTAADSFEPVPNQVETTATEEPEEPTEEPEPAAEETPAEETPEFVPPVIAGVQTFDPGSNSGENQDQAFRAFDGDPGTTWNSLRYNDPAYGVKEGVGLTIVLDEPTQVSGVILNVNGNGGLAQLRDGEQPNEGDVVVESAMSSDTFLELPEPVVTDRIHIWFPQLPVATSDGLNRIELAEISVQ